MTGVKGRSGRKPKPKAPCAVAPTGRPECPAHLTGLARCKWDELCISLEQIGILAVTDADALELYCTTYAAYLAALESWRHEGLDVKCDAYYITRDCQDRLLRLAVEFGLTPASRSRVKVGQPQETDPFEQILKLRGA